jgi:hypothetical protein
VGSGSDKRSDGETLDSVKPPGNCNAETASNKCTPARWRWGQIRSGAICATSNRGSYTPRKNCAAAPTAATLFGGAVREHSPNGTHVGTLIGVDPEESAIGTVATFDLDASATLSCSASATRRIRTATAV